MAFVTKFSSDGSEILYSSYLGGTESDNNPTAIVVDSAGSAWITGATQSGGFPVAGNAIQRVLTSDQNGFVTKVSPDGSKLLYSTYLGGGNTDNLLGLRWIARETLM
jgi:Tol biopolymer transport system component